MPPHILRVARLAMPMAASFQIPCCDLHQYCVGQCLDYLSLKHPNWTKGL